MSTIWAQFSPQMKSIIDIALVAYLVYNLYRLLSHSRVMPVMLGLLILMTISLFARWFQLETVGWLFETISKYLIFAVIIILQPELRRMFYSMGQTRWSKMFFPTRQAPSEVILQACLTLAEEKTGALIVMIRHVGLKQLTDGGILLQSQISRELLTAIFYKGNPLHDGAVIIEGRSIITAATYLPLSSSSILKRTHGARHRAALGISEESDALALVVSEEKRGKISVCFLGELQESIDAVTLKSILNAYNTDRLEDEWQRLFGKPKPVSKKKMGAKK